MIGEHICNRILGPIVCVCVRNKCKTLLLSNKDNKQPYIHWISVSPLTQTRVTDRVRAWDLARHGVLHACMLVVVVVVVDETCTQLA